ncbi:hypothetical protein ABW19_dt0202337 [Dactylella cylindrospora]|nr:hypothetical protein ABW19_dt0202337 [Dactylella cylindrospora]
MCYDETRHWSCLCRPVAYSHLCDENPSRNVKQCHSYQIRRSFHQVPCERCTPPPSPPGSPGNQGERIRHLTAVFESGALANAVGEDNTVRGKRHRRDSVGKLEDKCLECRLKGLSCDQKQSQCSNCRQSGSICESPREWVGRVSGKFPPATPPRSRSSSISSDFSTTPSLPVANFSVGGSNSKAGNSSRSQISPDLKHRRQLQEKPGREFDPTCESSHTHDSLEDLKKNIRALQATIDVLRRGGDGGLEEEHHEGDSDNVTGIDDFSSVEPFMDYHIDRHPGCYGWTEPTSGYEGMDLDLMEELGCGTEEVDGLNVNVTMPYSYMQGCGMPTSEDEKRVDNPSPPEDLQFSPALSGLTSISRAVRVAAKAAFRKLRRIAERGNVSHAFRKFVRSLGGLDDILSTGSQTFELLVDHGTPQSLKEIYCFLHFAYAMSQGDTDLLPPSDENEYKKGLLVFRSCLPSTPEYYGLHSERDIFDEIAYHMQHELECALRWAKTQNLTPQSFQGLQVTDILRLHSSSNVFPNTGLANWKPPSRIVNPLQPTTTMSLIRGYIKNTASAEEIRSLRVFDGVVSFLRASGIYKQPLHSKWYRQVHGLSDVDELCDIINRDIVNRIGEFKPTLPAISRILQTAVKMLELGSLITLEDFQEYVLGLFGITIFPFFPFKDLCDKFSGLLTNMIEKLPYYLLNRVMWEDSFGTFLSPQPVQQIITSASFVEAIAPASLLCNPWSPFATIAEVQSDSLQYAGQETNAYIGAYASQPTLEFETLDTVNCGMPDSPESVATPGTFSPFSQSPEPSVPSSEATGSPGSAPSKLHVCTVCNKAIVNRSNLNRHMRTKHNEKRAERKACPIPGCKTVMMGHRASGNIKTHLKKVHNIENGDQMPVEWRTDVFLGSF